MRILSTLLLCFTSVLSWAAPIIGGPVNEFSAQTVDGKTVNLSDYKGKIVILEWYNPDCPYVKKFYSTGKMQEMQKKVISEGAIWLTVNTGGKIADLAARVAADQVAATAVIDDAAGSLAKRFGATATPHCFVIGADGKLVYKGAIDSIPSTKSEDIARATNYVMAAYEAAKAGKAPEVPYVLAYGCGVKY